MTSRFAPSSCAPFFCAFFPCGMLAAAFLFALAPNAFAQEPKRLSPDSSLHEKANNKEHPHLRDRWMMQGRSAPRGQSAAALRLRAYRHKLAMRAVAQHESLNAAPPQTSTPWVALGPAPIISDQDVYGAVQGRI